MLDILLNSNANFNSDGSGSHAPHSKTLFQTSFIFRKPKELDLIAKVEPVVVDQGFLLRDIEIEGSRELKVRIVLDSASSEAIGIEDCVKIHRLLNPMFDLWDPFEKSYTLEVCSPGDKPSLRTLEHFQNLPGERIRFQTTEPLLMPEPMKPRKNWEGEFVEISGGNKNLVIKDNYGVHTVPVALVRDACWLRSWDLGDK